MKDTTSVDSNNCHARDMHLSRERGSGYLRRETTGIACLSITTICAITILVWVCVARGERTHSGSDLCASRKSENGFQGNGDFYGLGIRLGIYCQWFASIVANTCLEENMQHAMAVPYLGFQVAVLAALLVLVFESECTFIVEVVIVLSILLGGVFVVLAPQLVQSFRHVRWKEEQMPKYRLFSTFVWIIVGLMVPVAAWFWIRLAIDGDSKDDFYHTPGGTSIFLIVRVGDHDLKVAGILMAIWCILLGAFASEKIVLAPLYKVLGVELRPVFLFILEAFCWTTVLSFHLCKAAVIGIISSCEESSTRSIHERVRESLEFSVQLSLGDISRRPSIGPSTSRPETCSRLYALLLAIVSFVLSICAVELTLRWNHVSGINSIASTGQIIPLFAGLATLVSVVWELLKHIKRKIPPPQFLNTPSDDDASSFDFEASMWQSTYMKS